MRVESLNPEQIETDPNNVRRFFQVGKISELADSINEYGLLENLVVKQGEQEGMFYIVAGERRFRAINELIKDGRRNEDEEILVVVTDGNGTFENIVENLCREDVSFWDLGFRFNELIEAGFTQLDIASRSNKSQGFISKCIFIAKGLHPGSVIMLNNLRVKIPQSTLLKVASIKVDGEPNEKAQRIKIETEAGIRKHRRRRPPKRTDIQRMSKRVIYIQNEMMIPGHAQPYVDAIVGYITGTQKMKFPEEV